MTNPAAHIAGLAASLRPEPTPVDAAVEAVVAAAATEPTFPDVQRAAAALRALGNTGAAARLLAAWWEAHPALWMKHPYMWNQLVPGCVTPIPMPVGPYMVSTAAGRLMHLVAEPIAS